MEKVDFLPLGSVVVVKGGVKKFLIIVRGLGAKIGDDTKYFDYGGALYPEGIIGDNIMYFNHEDISKVVFEGFDDDDNKLMVANINDWIATLNMERGNTRELKNAGGSASGQ